MTKIKRSRLKPEIVKAIEEYARQGMTQSQVVAAMKADQRFTNEELPGDRTIQRRVADMQFTDPSGEWSVDSDATGDPSSVLDVLAALVGFTEGRVMSISNALAQVIVDTRQGRPDMPGQLLYIFSSMYLVCRRNKQSTKTLEIYLACAPWRGKEDQARYDEALIAGWIRSPSQGSPWTTLVREADGSLVHFENPFQTAND